MKAVVIIPARMAAKRFPGKPLAKIAGLSMIGHCFLRAKMARLVSQVFVATCDNEIAEEVKRLQGEVIMTSPKHERACDRVAEALCQLKSRSNEPIDIVVMLQGDEPQIDPDCIDQLIQHHEKYPDIAVFNLSRFIDDDEEFYSVDTVKLLSNLQSDILIFSREEKK